MVSTTSLQLRLDAPPTQPYPALLLDVGVYFRDRALMKRLDDADIDKLPPHTPVVNKVACRLWAAPDDSSDLYDVYVIPDSAALSTLVGSTKGESQTSLLAKLAHAAGVDENEYLDLAVLTHEAMGEIRSMMTVAATISSHNLQSDLAFLLAEHVRLGIAEYGELSGLLRSKSLFCTMRAGMKHCRTLLPGKRPRWPKLRELERDLLGRRSEKIPYDAPADLEVLEDCYHELVRRSVPSQIH